MRSLLPVGIGLLSALVVPAPVRAEGATVDPHTATRQILGALSEGLAEHVLWLTLGERGDVDARLRPWLPGALQGGIERGVLTTLIGELRGRPVFEPNVEGYQAGAREAWLLSAADALKGAIARWVAYSPVTAEEMTVARGNADDLLEEFRLTLERAEPAPPSEALDEACSALERELSGAAVGRLWLPILRPLRADEMVELRNHLQRLPAPSWGGPQYQRRAAGLGRSLVRYVWQLQTKEFGETQEAIELRALRDELQNAVQPVIDPRAPYRPEAHGEFGREVKRRDEALVYRSAAREGAAYPFVVGALLCVADALARRPITLP